ncbi:MAG TPA: 2-amino-4-hydroxy-6-hydroxymethyldihydropteridine diphosphokinase [Planctomycetota bacterium]|nr:2-amino-4-hydroxy-6-hydroxymethyldihydropteridine diphosphokinase [Planctomycetota bacterium]
MARALIALGSNVGDRRRAIETALAEICRLPKTCVVETSTLRETAPVGGPPQGDFLNGAALVETQLPPRELLAGLLEIERGLGRLRREPNGPRTIDLDLILYEDRVLNERGVEVPHPRFRERVFVLEPLAEVAPEAVDPVTKKTVRALFAELRTQLGK